MQKIVLILIVLIAMFNIKTNAQSATMTIHKTDKTVVTYNLSDIDSITFTPCTAGGCGNVTDNDGNVYNGVTIGTQCWMQQNLATTTYNDGTAIPLVTDGTAWGNLSTPGYCWYNDSAVKYKNTYGGLYNWYAVNTGKLCPAGWHVPDTTEWNTLVNYLGGGNVAGGAMKSTSSLWASPNTGATNSSGFSALPGGYRSYYGGAFYYVGYFGLWWSATEDYSGYAWGCGLTCSGPNASLYYYDGEYGFSVRCVRD